MNDWAIVAASGIPLDATIAAMAEAKQPYNTVAGWIFAVAGIVLAGVWAAVTAIKKRVLPSWATAGLWGLLLAFGAPAFFYASFANMNSVGDTFYDWNSDAAFALEAPLYIASAAGFAIAALAMVYALVSSVRAPRTPFNQVAN